MTKIAYFGRMLVVAEWSSPCEIEKKCLRLTNMRCAYKSLRLISLLSAIIALSYIASNTCLFAHVISPTITPPIIRWDSKGDPSPPGPINGVTTFTPATGLLSMSGKIVSFTPGTIPWANGPIIGPPRVYGWISVSASLAAVSVVGPNVHADFVTTGSPGFDVNIWDIGPNLIQEFGGGDDVLALAGDFGDLTIDGIIGSNIGSGGAIFTPLGGYLLSDFLPGTGGIVHLEFNAVPNWSAASYTASWTSESKGRIGAPAKPALGALHRIVAQPYLH